MTVTYALVAAGAAGVLWVVTLFAWWRRWRRVRTQIHAAASRLDESSVPEHRGLEATISQLQTTVEAAVARSGDEVAASTRMAHALSAIDDGIVLIDDAGDVAFANAVATTYLSARHSDAIVESSIEELAEAALDGVDGSRTLEIFGPPRRTLILSASPLDDGHRSIGALVVIEDVTERQRIDAVRRDFVANISHELKTPVGGLGVLAETLIGEDDLDLVQRLAARINHEAIRASRTIDDLLELSRIEAGEALTRDPVPVHLVLAEATERAATAAEQKGMVVDLREPSHRVEVVGDRRQLVSAVFNLLDNAVKYSSPGSSVTVAAETDGEFVRISVADTGIGIPRRDLERIFERFYRVDRARSRETGGTGLGLAIVRHVASNHGGEVSVSSREGEGTTFELCLPAGSSPVAVTREAG